MRKQYLIIICLLILLVGGLVTFKLLNNKEEVKTTEKKDKKRVLNDDNSFNLKVIKSFNNSLEKENYLISPYSIEIALNLLKEGADGNSLKEIEKVLPDRSINYLEVKDRIGVANGLFVKNKYKDFIEKKYINTLDNNYNSEFIYDEFNTPNKINDWVNDKTKGMIPKLMNNISDNFVLGIVNALAIDVDWADNFECSYTREAEFKLSSGKNKEVEMMSKYFKDTAKYFDTGSAKGVILPYVGYNKKTGEKDYDSKDNLEFIGILSNNDIKDYIKNLDDEELNKIDKEIEEANKSFHIDLSLPRFKYDASYDEKFINVLNDLGIKEVFSKNNANLNRIISKETRDKNKINNLYVDTAIHKTHIELNEKGTKAAAVTAFIVNEATAIYEPTKPKVVEIKFNKPFAYMIRDSKTKELLFFGVVYEPNEWKGSTCSDEE